MTLTLAQLNDIKDVWCTSATISLVGSLFVISSLLFLRLTKVLSYRLLLVLASVSMVKSIISMFSIGIPVATQNGFCYFQGLMVQVTNFAEFSWIAIIATNLFICVVWQKNLTRRWEYGFHGVAWSVNIVFAILPMITDNYGNTGPWCWIVEKKPGDIGDVWRFLVYYIPLYICIFYIFVVYIYSSKKIYLLLKQANDARKEGKKRYKTLIRLIAYPIVFVCLWIVPVANRINSWAGGQDNFGVWLVHGYCAPAFGHVNAIIFAIDVRKYYLRYFREKLRSGLITTDNKSTSSISSPSKEKDHAKTESMDANNLEPDKIATNTTENQKAEWKKRYT